MATCGHLMRICLILTVLPYGRNLYVSIPKEQYEVVKGGEVTLPCTFSPSNPDYQDLVLTWTAFPDKEGDTMIPVATYFLGNPSSVSSDYEGRVFLEVDPAQKTSTLRITKVTMQDSRYFQCHVQILNDDEGKTIAATSVLVLVPPSPPICKIEGQPQYGHNITLTCKSEEGSPKPVTKWKTFSVQNVPRPYPPKAFESPDGALRLFNVSRDTSGFFICDSTNRLGSQSCNLTLSVMPGSMNFGSTALIVVGVLVGVVLVGILIFCCYRRRRAKRKNVEGEPEDVYFDKNTPETGEEYEDSEPSKETKLSQPVKPKTVPQNYRNDRKVGAKYEDDQDSYNSDKDNENASHRYQNENEGHRGSRDHLDDKNNHYRGSYDRLDDQRNRYGGSRDRLDDSRDQYRGSRDRLDDSRDQYRGSRDRLDDSRDQYRGSRDPAYDNRDQYRPSRDRQDDYRDHHRGSQDRLDDRSDSYRGGSHSDHYGGSSHHGHYGGGDNSGGYSYGDD